MPVEESRDFRDAFGDRRLFHALDIYATRFNAIGDADVVTDEAQYRALTGDLGYTADDINAVLPDLVASHLATVSHTPQLPPARVLVFSAFSHGLGAGVLLERRTSDT